MPVHMKIKVEVFGEEYWNNEMTYAVTKLDLVKVVQARLAAALLELNKAGVIKKVA